MLWYIHWDRYLSYNVNDKAYALAFIVFFSSLTWSSYLQCSVTCQRGVKQRAVRCVDISNSLVNESFCRHTQKPSAIASCFAGSCKMEWFASNKWSHVSAVHSGVGIVPFEKTFRLLWSFAQNKPKQNLLKVRKESKKKIQFNSMTFEFLEHHVRYAAH